MTHGGAARFSLNELGRKEGKGKRLCWWSLPHRRALAHSKVKILMRAGAVDENRKLYPDLRRSMKSGSSIFLRLHNDSEQQNHNIIMTNRELSFWLKIVFFAEFRKPQSLGNRIEHQDLRFLHCLPVLSLSIRGQNLIANDPPCTECNPFRHHANELSEENREERSAAALSWREISIRRAFGENLWIRSFHKCLPL